ncbi:PREDICTED: uncharacterized protein LOC105970647 [Erythranthe guttata]|uniref:uncharacterized protein LOC105970647 n=1 Tax=Erythranthe guttata TaxID=4155 RepID=UPI00064E0C50|nr:PREDICTED: uncharacterized protein LOC105970647 [Erythranthe guttata]|eukprot:XP_012850934.1 PREDICTED: uncharacterized protein LOC105970647 [Erythranthe guttata]
MNTREINLQVRETRVREFKSSEAGDSGCYAIYIYANGPRQKPCERSNPYFQRKLDRAQKLGFSSLQKVTVAMRMLAYAYSADSIDETFHMAETTATETLREFCKTILRLYKDEYLRAPTNADMTRLLDKAERRGFPGMIGSLDCMHWTWKNCPTAWQGSFSGRKHKPTIILEAVASSDTWIWHAFFGVPGSQNDITVLGRSPLFDNLVQGISPRVHYQVNEKDHYMAYYLADGIYPKWGTLIQSIKQPRTHQEQLFSKMQEAYRKDVERAFGILQARFAIVKQPGRGWNLKDLRNIMMTCIVLHNMIVEDERDEYADAESDDDDNNPATSRRARANSYDRNEELDLNPRTSGISIIDYMRRRHTMRSVEVNRNLQRDLIAHV